MRLAALGLAAVMTVGAASTVMAAEWKKDSTGWWWQNDDGSYPISSWQWLDGNKDGVAEYYYFDSTGYMLENTKTPDGNTVNADGAWILDGVVQTQTVAAAAPVQETQQAASQGFTDDYTGRYVLDNGEITLMYDKATNSIYSVETFINDEGNLNVFAYKYTYFGPTYYNGHIMFELVTDEGKDAITFAAPGLLDWYDENGAAITVQRQAID